MQYIIIILLFFIAPDFYIWSQFVRGGALSRTILYFIPLALTLGCMGVMLSGAFRNEALRILFLLLLFIALPKLLFTLFSLIGKGIGLLLPYAATVGNVTGLIVAALMFIIATVGTFWGWKHLVVQEKQLSFDSLPAAFDGYKIVQLSDFHIGTYASAPEVVQQIVDKVNAQDPDLIVFTGDIVNGHPSEMLPFMNILSQLKAKDGVISIMGNHDYCMFHHYENANDMPLAIDDLQNREREMGWRLLLNEHIILHKGNDSIAVIGVENDSKPPFPKKGDLTLAMKGLDNDIFKILLSHDPTHWRREVLPKSDVQLTLSGHTHAMQIRLFGYSPSAFAFSEWGGLYRDGSRVLNVSIGNGSNIPFRFGAWPEINVLILKK